MENRPYVFAMRIYLKNGHKPMADLAIMKEGQIIRVDTIEYDNIATREQYYINAYTLIWDERIYKGYTFEQYLWGHA